MAKAHAKPIVHTAWRRAAGYATAVTPVRLRLYTGLWLLFYAATHLINHALGLISLAAAEGGRIVFLAFWRQPLVELTRCWAFSSISFSASGPCGNGDPADGGA